MRKSEKDKLAAQAAMLKARKRGIDIKFLEPGTGKETSCTPSNANVIDLGLPNGSILRITLVDARRVSIEQAFLDTPALRIVPISPREIVIEDAKEDK